MEVELIEGQNNRINQKISLKSGKTSRKKNLHLSPSTRRTDNKKFN